MTREAKRGLAVCPPVLLFFVLQFPLKWSKKSLYRPLVPINPWVFSLQRGDSHYEIPPLRSFLESLKTPLLVTNSCLPSVFFLFSSIFWPRKGTALQHVVPIWSKRVADSSYPASCTSLWGPIALLGHRIPTDLSPVTHLYLQKKPF